MPRFRPLVLELTAYASELLGRFEKCTAELIIEAIELRFLHCTLEKHCLYTILVLFQF